MHLRYKNACAAIRATDALAEEAEEFTADPDMHRGEIGLRTGSRGQLARGDAYVKLTGDGVEPNDVAITDPRNRTAIRCFRSDVNGCRHLT